MEIHEKIEFFAEFEEKDSIFKKVLGNNIGTITQAYSLSNGAVKMLLNDEVLEIPNVYGILKIIDDYDLYDYIKERLRK